MRRKLLWTLVNILSLCVFILVVSSYFVFHSEFIGPVIFSLGLLCLLSLFPFGISVNSIWADIVFGMIDNGILAALAIFGGEIGGVIGAVIGGVVGNAVTDGIAGIFEGLIAEKNAVNGGDSRTILGSSVGKMAGCLLSAGFVLTAASLLM